MLRYKHNMLFVIVVTLHTVNGPSQSILTFF